MKTGNVRTGVALAVVAALQAWAPQGRAQDAPASAAEQALDEIVVTAQRRSEALERTPVAVAAISADTLRRNAIVSEADLQTAVPGLIVKAGQSSNQINYSLRGQTVDAFSSSRPSVLPYFNEVQVGGTGATSFYDLESIQVLKGPQGTLFGRNSTGGAVLLTTAKPTNEFEGSASVRVGNYDLRQVQAVLNTPLSDDRVLLRFAANYEKADGFQKNAFWGNTNGDIDRKNARLSLTLKGARASNELVVDYGDSGGNNVGSVVYNVFPTGQGNPFVPTNFLYTPALDAAFGPGAWASYLRANPKVDPAGLIAFTAKQQARGPFDISTDGLNFHESKDWIVSNITTFELNDSVKLRNILGYVDRETWDSSEFDGTPYGIDSNGGRGRGGPTTQLSEEFQVVGETGALDYVAGLYYADEEIDTYSLSLIVELLPFIPVTAQVNQGTTESTTYAAYAQGSYDLGGLTGVEGLSATLGARYSSEDVSFTRGPLDQYVTSPNPAYVDPLEDTYSKVSWTAGLDWQATDELLVYGVSRRSFRSGGFNFFAPPLPGYGNEGGAAYDAETATDIELGLKYKGELAGLPTRVNLAAYNMWVENIQRSTYVQIFGALAGITVNVPEAKIAGVELDGVVSPAEWLDLGWSVNYTDAKFTDNEVAVIGNPSTEFGPYPDTPEWSGSTYASATVPVGALELRLRGDFYAQTSTWFSSTGATLNPGTQIPGYGLTNLQIGLEKPGTGWSVSANVKNAFDKVYYVGGIGFSSLFAVNTVIPGAPRTYSVEARYRF
jgi:iron complex outermembrane receptor protein